MRTILTLFSLSVLISLCDANNQYCLQGSCIPTSNDVLSDLLSDSSDRNWSGNYMVHNLRIQKGDTFYYYYAGSSNSCLEEIESSQLVADSTYDLVSIEEEKWFKYRFSLDSIAIADAEKENRTYYLLTWHCQKGGFNFYIENDTLFALNPFRDAQSLANGGENYNELPRWLPYPINRLNENEFEIQFSSPAFYPIFNPNKHKKIRTIFSKAKSTWIGPHEIWIKN